LRAKTDISGTLYFYKRRHTSTTESTGKGKTALPETLSFSRHNDKRIRPFAVNLNSYRENKNSQTLGNIYTFK